MGLLADPSIADGSQSIRCPLCDYDLRGLPEPRCPECGARYTWEELRERRIHPYLYEQHPERGFYAFLRTLVGGLRPFKFWRSLRPVHQVSRKRLVRYWLIYSLAPLLVVLATMFSACVSFASTVNWIRAAAPQWPTNNNWYQQMIQRHGSIANYLDADFPRPPSGAFFRKAAQFNPIAPWLALGLCAVAWPWLTLLTMLLIPVTLHRAQIKVEHLQRCVVYACDVFAWLVIAAAGIVAWAVVPGLAATRGTFGIWSPHSAVLFQGLSMLVVVLAVPVRLAIAFRCYLQLRHAVATAVLLQVMLLLASLVFAQIAEAVSNWLIGR